jgi:two-component system, OmpR family, phosphate regulon response regulator PhoB
MNRIRTILLVEDETSVSDLVSVHLQQNGYNTIVVSEGARALELVAKQPPSLVILDVMLPDMNGVDILREIRMQPATARLPVLLLTGCAEEADRILGLEVGADDYVTKPFSPRELLLRVGKIIEAREAQTGTVPTTFGRLRVDENRFEVTVDDSPIPISATEMRLLSELLRCRGRVLTRNELLQNAWGYLPNVTERTVDTHVKRLRQKLGAASEYLETVRGVGYRWCETPPETAPGVEKASE